MKPFDLLRGIVLNAKKRIEPRRFRRGSHTFFYRRRRRRFPARTRPIGLLNSCRRQRDGAQTTSGFEALIFAGSVAVRFVRQ